MLNELRGQADKLNEKFIKGIGNIKMKLEDIKKNQSEMHTILTEIKNTLQGINSRLHEAEDQITYLEYKETENTQSEQQKEKIQNNEGSIKSFWDNFKLINIHIMGGARRRRQNKELTIMTENCPNLVKEIRIGLGPTSPRSRESQTI